MSEFGSPNLLKGRLKSGEVVVGTMFVAVHSPGVGHLVKNAGFDFLILDTEHSWFTTREVAEAAQSCRRVGLTFIVRVPEKRYEVIARTLDIGAEGILVPHADTPEEAEEVVKWAKYPPRGMRGIATRTLQSGFISRPMEEWTRWQDEYTLVIAQVESEKAVENAEAIGSINGVDILFVGPSDLSLSMGLPKGHPEVERAIEKVVGAARRAGKPCGIHVFDLESARRWVEAGMNFICYGSDVFFLAEAKGSVEHIKKG